MGHTVRRAGRTSHLQRVRLARMTANSVHPLRTCSATSCEPMFNGSQLTALCAVVEAGHVNNSSKTKFRSTTSRPCV